MGSDVDVLVVGAGPAGLLLAGDLAETGVRCTVVERREGESQLTRAFAVHARTMEQLDARGVADDLLMTGLRNPILQFLRIDLSHLPTRYPHVLVTPQYNTERLLLARALEHGVNIMRAHEVTGVQQDPAGVDVTVKTPAGTEQSLRADYVVGADGRNSCVRQSLGLPFPGRSAVRSMMLADVRMADPPKKPPTVAAIGDAFAIVVPFGDGWFRVMAWNRHHPMPDNASVDLEEIKDVARQALGSDFGMHDPRWLSRFHSDERQSPRYRVGRVFLVGDAAHVHSPAGGMGLNTSIQDSANLSWKLAAVQRGRAPDTLLDSYQNERHPVGHRVLRMSGALLRGVLTTPRALCGLRDLSARTVLQTPPVARRLAKAISGIDISYTAPAGAHPLVGKRAPDIPLTDGRRLYEALRKRRFVLVTPSDTDRLPSLITEWTDEVEIVSPRGATKKCVLVRPDAYIAWAISDESPEHRITAARRALTEWCGTQGTSSVASSPR
ncbi:FAD-dependent monooxygenase [Streptomyces mirabilis]|jgi:2-polyprenyl-6-methoxyphenol hydroxylase-like FAD-dependent oxidoreductase|uniref:2-polyprenyl-6-methoxyphenol hydroxylase n=1 Tax=Streptomyces mirabilis TaxID=68239 RepID=A0A1I2Y9S2_9ACTN|nr:FAD-dependent monooxygenase [Streptomyces mirabilis]SFH21111.1 2-polyprenyl-6-methoxyphenol hydroxylase [Streptomyces mirabilis]